MEDRVGTGYARGRFLIAALGACLAFAPVRHGFAQSAPADCSRSPTSLAWSPARQLVPPPRPSQTPLRRQPEMNVKAFGALGDGRSDDTAAVNKAFAALPTEGGSLYFPAGEYILSTNLDLVVGKHDVEVFGDGISASVLRRSSVPRSGRNFGLISVADGANWTIRDLGIVGAANRSSEFTHFGKGIYLVNSPDALVFRVEVSHVEGEGIYASGDSPRVRFLENYVRHGLGAALNLNSSRHHSVDSIIADNDVVDNRSGAVQATGRRVTVARNRVRFPWPLGSDIILIVNSGELSCEHNVVSGSDISIATVSPIHIWNNDGMPTLGVVCGNRIVDTRTSNHRSGGGAGIYVDNAGGSVEIRSNLIRGIGRQDARGTPAVRIAGEHIGRVCVEGNSFEAGDANHLDVGVSVDSTVSTLAAINIGRNRYLGLSRWPFATEGRIQRVGLCDGLTPQRGASAQAARERR